MAAICRRIATTATTAIRASKTISARTERGRAAARESWRRPTVGDRRATPNDLQIAGSLRRREHGDCRVPECARAALQGALSKSQAADGGATAAVFGRKRAAFWLYAACRLRTAAARRLVIVRARRGARRLACSANDGRRSLASAAPAVGRLERFVVGGSASSLVYAPLLATTHVAAHHFAAASSDFAACNQRLRRPSRIAAASIATRRRTGESRGAR